MQGRYVAIKNYEIHDGDGIRTTVFLKGCPLSCKWCHNPECISYQKEIGFYQEKCVQCGDCVKVCPHHCHQIKEGKIVFDRTNCESCKMCEQACLSKALHSFGEDIESDELVKILVRDKIFFDSLGGGVTISGGEPLYQGEFTIELAKKLKEQNISVMLDTCLFANSNLIRKIAPYIDKFLVDIKTINSSLHKDLTGQDNQIILNNIHLLDELGKDMEIRIPYIPAFNSGEIPSIGEFLTKIKHVTGIKVLPYHFYAKDKYMALNKPYPAEEVVVPTEEEIKKARDILKSYHLPVLDNDAL